MEGLLLVLDKYSIQYCPCGCTPVYAYAPDVCRKAFICCCYFWTARTALPAVFNTLLVITLYSDALISLFRFRYDIDTILTKYRYIDTDI